MPSRPALRAACRRPPARRRPDGHPAYQRTPHVGRMEPPGCTGTRIGEALAVRWEDLDSSEQPPTLTISGTIVYVKGKGFYRQPWTKSDAGYRTIVLPKFVVAILEWRRAEAKPNDLDAVFLS